MARTATKDKAEAQETIPVTNPDADNHHMVMTLAATNSPDQLPGGSITVDMADERLRTWQRQGYTVKTSQVIQAGDVNGIFTLQVFCLLVKE